VLVEANQRHGHRVEQRVASENLVSGRHAACFPALRSGWRVRQKGENPTSSYQP
jgi:hypothetical protein